MSLPSYRILRPKKSFMPVVKMSNSVNESLGHEHGLENTFGFRKKKEPVILSSTKG